MNKKQILKKLYEALSEWEDMLEIQGGNWDQYDIQQGEINGLEYAIGIIEDGL